MDWKRLLLALLGTALLVAGIKEPMLLIFPMWIFTFLFRRELSGLVGRLPLALSFIGSGLVFGLLTEVFAILENSSRPAGQRVLLSPDPLLDLVYGFFYYLLVVLTWYLLLRRMRYSATDIFIITGIYGIFAEESGKVFMGIFTTPLTGLLYAVMVFFVYGIFPMLAFVLSSERFRSRKSGFLRYAWAFAALFVQWAVYGLLFLPLLKVVSG